MVVTEGGPLPKRLLADIEMIMKLSPFSALSEQGSGSMEGTVQIPCTQDDAEIMRVSQISLVPESV